MTHPARTIEPWPSLPLDGWRETQETLHLWTQVTGKIKLALTPFLNEWWNVALTVTPRGLTTGSIPNGDEAFGIDFDFINHHLFIRDSKGQTESIALVPKTVASFHAEVLETLNAMGITVTINPMPSEIPNAIRLDLDTGHASYDPASVERWWRILVQTDQVMQRYRSSFVGKSSPINFFWGSFDLNATRFSGRPTTPPAGAPYFLQLAESQENFSCGFWPGNTSMSGVTLGEPAFYAYIYPEPAGFREASILSGAARYDERFGQFLLPYADVVRTESPGNTVQAFFEGAYEAAATLANWDRSTLERTSPEAGH